ncbi:mRNA 3'-end-processing protein rna14 [Coemansia helicoidea]|uniref:mRNA 3'-end-processing protein rna14 n=1 Tax=Coemansia helicoidea TaxID=1286919 RepID=A0ACC1LB66_9FUNG|nr:mRNA 3'-end-processing protein rna14 [Coemansia helicoidea]
MDSAPDAPTQTDLQQQQKGPQPSGFPEVDMYRRRVARSAHDAEAWSGLLRAAKASGSEQLLYDTYVDALKQYPGSGHLLAEFVELELNRGNKHGAETIFNDNLFSVPSIELWRCYLNYVLQANADGQGGALQSAGRATLMDCYKLVLDNIGSDREAGQIWVNYIAFINSAQTHAPYEEQQKADLLREAYQRAVAIPMLRVEEIWKGYDAFENRMDRPAAKKVLSKISPSYMTARTALRDLNRIWDAIRATRSPHGLPAPPEWTSREIEHLDAWKRYLAWEVSNPLRLSDPAAVRQRVVYAYEQACTDLRFYPEVWIEFADYFSSSGQPSEALARLRTASSVLPASLAVQFAYAETAEMLKQLDVCKDVYEQVVRTLKLAADRVTDRYARKLASLEKKLAGLSAAPGEGDGQAAGAGAAAGSTPAGPAPAAPTPAEAPDSESEEDSSGLGESDADTSMASDSDADGGGGGSGSGAGRNDPQKRAEQRAARARKAIAGRIEHVEARRDDELKGKREAYTLAWIMYLRFTQRAEGIDAVRQLLRRPRSEPAGSLTHHLFVAAALMEYHVAKRADVAGKLFEHYAKAFPDSGAYIMEYMGYLISSGDDTNVRALFERVHGTAVADTSDIWDRFADFEYSYGDMSAISKLDKRTIEKFKHESVLTRMASRYSYLDADYVGVAEFGIPHRPEMQPDALAGAGGYRSHPASARDERRRAVNAGAGDRRRAGSTAAGGLPNIAVASITGRYLNKSQLLATVTPNRFTRPAVGQMKEYKPVVDHAHRPGAPRRAPGDAGPHPAAALPPPPPPPPAAAAAPMPAPQQLLDHGDVLSYVAASVAAPNTSAFDSVALNSDALLGTIMQLSTLGPAAQSNYRPLSYMPWLSRADHGPQQAHGGGFHRSDHGGRSSGGRSRSRGRYSGDADSHGHPGRHGGRGPAHRQPPYARSPAHAGGGRSPRHAGGGLR